MYGTPRENCHVTSGFGSRLPALTALLSAREGIESQGAHVFTKRPSEQR